MLSIGFNYMKLKFKWDDHGPVILYGITGYKKKHPDHYEQDLTVLCGLLEKGVINPKIHKRFPFAEEKEAMEAVESGTVTGKVVIEVEK